MLILNNERTSKRSHYSTYIFQLGNNEVSHTLKLNLVTAGEKLIIIHGNGLTLLFPCKFQNYLDIVQRYLTSTLT